MKDRPRLAYVLAYNCLHHLRHQHQAERLLDFFDHVVVVEGAAQNGGSTAWCRPHPARQAASTDGTRELLLQLAQQHPDRVTVVTAADFWPSKDDMVHAALDHLRDHLGPSGAYLWQVDADEVWSLDQLARAEAELERHGGDCGLFLCDYFVGPRLVARGEWGEGRALPYRRLWKWDGRQAETHEPPRLVGGNGREVLLAERFAHFAYYFEQDVNFKARYYGGHQELAVRWPRLQRRPARDFPLPLSALFGRHGYGMSQTTLHHLDNPHQ